MLGTLLAVMTVFLFFRESAIDSLPKRREKLGVLGAIWEAITAHSHRPAYPAEVALGSGRDSNPREAK
jgi:hypothetical protein